MENELILKSTGMVSLMLFILANGYYPARLVANQFRPWSAEVALLLQKYLDIHMWLNVIAFALMTINTFLAGDHSIFPYASLLVTVGLALAGILKRSKSLSRDMGKRMQLLHAQQTIFVVWLVLLASGVL